jgi:hypothetical protein
MKGWSARVACLVAALLAAPAAAAASRHHKHKPKPPPAAAATPADDAETGQGADDAAKADPTPAPEPAPPERSGAAEPTDEAPPKAIPRPLVPAAVAAPTVNEIATTGDEGDALAVGRREATRLAAGRIESAVSVGIDAGRRQFTYSDPIGAAPRPYLLPAVPLATLELEVYPLATTDIPVLCDLGFRGRVSRAFAIDSSTSTGVPLDNSWTRFTGELRGRVLAGGRRAFQLGVSAGVDGSYFDLDSRTDVGALVPSARTLSFRVGVDARAHVAGRVSLLAGGAYLTAISRGEIYDHFRSPQVAGVDAELAVALALTRGVEMRVNGRYTRYFASFDPEVGDPAVAGGALDEQSQLGVALRYAH